MTHRVGRAAGLMMRGCIVVVTAMVCACSPQLRAPAVGLDRTALAAGVATVAARSRPATLGVGVRDLRTGETWYLNRERRFPMQSVFKVALGAAVLERVDQGALVLARPLTLTRADLSSQHSPLAAAFRGDRQTYTVEDLLRRAVGASDNTAADVLMRLIGGPAVVNDYLRRRGVAGMRVDRYESELQPQVNGLSAFRPEWSDWAVMSAAIDAVPIERRREAFRAYLADPRDTSTPEAAVELLTALVQGRLLSAPSTDRLARIMTEGPTGPGRLRAAAPTGSVVAHKTGNSNSLEGVNGVANDVGVITLPDGRPIVVAVFVTGSTLDEAGRDKVIADVGRAAIGSLR